jgi:hypothetical protein
MRLAKVVLRRRIVVVQHVSLGKEIESKVRRLERPATNLGLGCLGREDNIRRLCSPKSPTTCPVEVQRSQLKTLGVYIVSRKRENTTAHPKG